MGNVLMYLGGIVGVGAAVLLACGLIAGGVALLARQIAAIEHRGEVRQMEWVKNKLRSSAWWFSEDTPTMTLLMDLAEMNEWEARKRWQNNRGKP